MTKKEEQVVQHLATPELLKAAKERKKAMKAEHGPFATLKKFGVCEHCGKEVGVREKRRHSVAFRKYGDCSYSGTANADQRSAAARKAAQARWAKKKAAA